MLTPLQIVTLNGFPRHPFQVRDHAHRLKGSTDPRFRSVPSIHLPNHHLSSQTFRDERQGVDSQL